MKTLRYSFFLVYVLLLGCSKEDDGNPFSPDNFYNDADKSVTNSELIGTWAIFSGEFQGERADIPADFEACGRNFFVFAENSILNDYVYQSSDCVPQTSQSSWQLKDGVITVSSGGANEELVVTKLTGEELVFKVRLDVDEDGELDIFKFFSRKFEPKDVDLVSNTFNRNSNDDFEDLISLSWSAYDGFNDFHKYEVFRNSGKECSKAGAELVATITDPFLTTFTDFDPPSAEQLCYFLKVYTNKGLLGESYLISLTPSSFIYPDPVHLELPVVQGNSIGLEWQESDSPYFSHYEVVLLNSDNSASQSETLAIIDSQSITSFTHDELPYFENPYYRVIVHNIFGNVSAPYSSEVTDLREVIIKRDEVVALQNISSYAVDPTESVVYFYGLPSGSPYQPRLIIRHNYETRETEKISDISPTVQTSIPIKVFNSPNGKEVIIHQGTELHLYNAETLEYKYAINPEGILSMDDFVYDEDLDVWIISDSDDIFTLKRDNTNLFLVDSAPHFVDHQGGLRYELFQLSGNRILLGHPYENNSKVYTYDSSGDFLNTETVSFKVKSINEEMILSNEEVDILIDTAENRIYSGTSFALLSSFEFPTFPSGISSSGELIYGVNNDPDWQTTAEDSPHKKEAIIYDRQTGNRRQIETIGYPQIIFQNYKGEVISISSGLKRNSLYYSYHDNADIFFEKLNLD